MRALMRGRWAVLLAAALAAGCHRGPRRFPGPTSTYTHPLGLVLTVPSAIGRQPVVVENTPRGFVVTCCKGRFPGRVTVELESGAAAPPGDWRKTRTIADVEVQYTILDLDGGGSGGEAYRLSAWRPARAGHLLYVQEDQSEWGEPGFDLAWTVMEGTKLSP